MRDTDNYWTRLQSRRSSRRRFLAGSGALAAGTAAILAGCGDDDDSSTATKTATSTGTSTGTASGTSSATASGTATGSATQAGTPKRGGQLKLWKTAADGGLDPAVFHLQNRDILERIMNFPIAYQVTKNLVSMDGMTKYELVDPTTLNWTVRPGMKFQNGDPLDAEAWAYSVNRVISLNKEKGGSTHTPPPTFTYIDSVKAIDANTVQEKWKRPSVDFIAHRSRHYYGWINPKVAEAKGVAASAGLTKEVQDMPAGISGGPYTLEQHDATGTLVKRWPGYYNYDKADDGFVAQGGPYIDSQLDRIIPDRSAAKAAFQAGDLDWFGALDKLEVDEFKNNNKVKIVEVPATGTSLLGMDGGKFFDVRARQALQKGFDYEGFIKSIRQGNGLYGTPINYYMPQFQKISQADLKSKWYKYDPAEAKKLWSAAAPPVQSMKILISTGDPLVNDIYDFVAQSYKQSLGIDVKVEAVDINTWAARAIDRKNPTKDWELLGYGAGTVGVVTGEPTDNALVHFDPAGYGVNAFNFYADSPHQEIKDGSAHFTELMNKQSSEFDLAKRAAILTELQTWILDNHWCNFALPTAKTSFSGWGARLQDYAPDDWYNNYGIRRHSIWLNA